MFAKTIFITGGAGFIGSNYLNKYVVQNPDTRHVNIDCLTYAGNLTNITVSDAPNYEFSKVDIRDYGALAKLFETHKPTGVIHFAAESHVDLSIENPNVFIETNVIGTNNLLRLAYKHGVERFHQISTDEVYGMFTTSEGSFLESNALAPRNPYSASKASAELMVRAYRETFGLDTVITRSSNAYGPGQDATKLIPRFISKLLSGEKVPLYGKGEQMREWTYVEDCIEGIHTAYTKGAPGSVYNIGSGVEFSNIELTRKLLALTGKDESAIEYVEDRKGHDFRYSVNTDKIKSELGWSTKVPFEEGLQRTLDFYKQQYGA